MSVSQQAATVPRGRLAPLPEMDEEQFRCWSELLEKRTGIVVPPERKSFLVTSLGMRMREIGCGSFQEYYEYLHDGRRGMVEWAVLMDRLTVHETRFFRHQESLDLVRERFLPKMAAPEGRPLNVQAWSVGCASGEEAYTLAMVIDAHLQALGCPYYFGITATDISLESLAAGRKGLYPAHRLTEVPAAFRKRYFHAADKERYQVIDALRERICFARLNVLEIADAPIDSMDLICCQNVLIYFDRERRHDILDRLVAHLKPGGALILAPGDVMNWERAGIERVRYPDTLAFVRVDPTDKEQTA